MLVVSYESFGTYLP